MKVVSQRSGTKQAKHILTPAQCLMHRHEIDIELFL